jgi:N4 Gp49/Sf6 Gp66 family protein
MSIHDDESASAQFAIAPRVSIASMEEKIREKHDLILGDALGTTGEHPANRMSLCILVMENGFIVIGKSAPASAENFRRELGRKFAYEDAIRQLWQLEGYALRSRLTREED